MKLWVLSQHSWDQLWGRVRRKSLVRVARRRKPKILNLNTLKLRLRWWFKSVPVRNNRGQQIKKQRENLNEGENRVSEEEGGPAVVATGLVVVLALAWLTLGSQAAASYTACTHVNTHTHLQRPFSPPSLTLFGTSHLSVYDQTKTHLKTAGSGKEELLLQRKVRRCDGYVPTVAHSRCFSGCAVFPGICSVDLFHVDLFLPDRHNLLREISCTSVSTLTRAWVRGTKQNKAQRQFLRNIIQFEAPLSLKCYHSAPDGTFTSSAMISAW